MRLRVLRGAVVCGGLTAVLAGTGVAKIEVAVQPTRTAEEKVLPAAPAETAPEEALAQGTFVPEVEPNNAMATATPLGGADVLATGTILPGLDEDWWSFSAIAGDRIYVALQTAFSS